MPATIRSRIISSESHAGPMVQIIFARRTLPATSSGRPHAGTSPSTKSNLRSFNSQILSLETVITIDYFQEGVTSEAIRDSAGAHLILSEFLRLPADAELSSVRADRSWH